MSKKYKFIITLPDDIEVDSYEEIEGHVSWPNWSQADPIRFQGVFDTYEEAMEYAKDFKLYSYTLNYCGYDTFYSEDFPEYFISIYDAEDAVCRYLDIDPGDYVRVNAERFTVEDVEYEGNKVYKYCLFYNGECVYDSIDEDDEYYESYEEAEHYAETHMRDYEIEIEGLDNFYSLEPIEVVSIRVEEFELEDIEE